MTSVFTDKLGPFAALAAPSHPVAKSHLATGFGDQLKGEATPGQTHAPIAGSDYGMYANVVVKGKVVASMSNSGCCVIADGYGGAGMADALDMPGDGPQLAQRRAELIAKALGGTVEKLSTAQTPEQWAKTGKTVGMIDLWGLDSGEEPGHRPAMPQHSMDLLLRQQETSDEAAA